MCGKRIKTSRSLRASASGSAHRVFEIRHLRGFHFAEAGKLWGLQPQGSKKENKIFQSRFILKKSIQTANCIDAFE